MTTSLLGIAPALDDAIQEVAYNGERYSDFHPANAGDISQVFDAQLSRELVDRFTTTMSDWFDITRLQDLASIRCDGRAGYRTEGIENPGFYELLVPITGRVMLITRTGSDIASIKSVVDCGQDGKLFNLVQVDDTGKRIRIIYGNKEYGSIPSIETHIHIAANAMHMAEGCDTPATVHAHPPYLVALGRHPKVAGDFERFNAVVYTAVEGLNRNHKKLMGVVPYHQSGSADLVDSSLDPLKKHGFVLWMHHGATVRQINIRQGYVMLGYAEHCARMGLDSVREGALRMPDKEIVPFLEEKGLKAAYDVVFET
ncbi:hypothetical protein COV18_04595 [Candidatus Woesearchaeota archaeon CG10_big_fil_rev_8_21_14_0_10_37_12]|nr:MAG: hypothetical protein COV18_04595 [Candidatus Woesearchaeota archaeon CG10_big_fil_rev_8_21_14_0_10_37_12]